MLCYRFLVINCAKVLLNDNFIKDIKNSFSIEMSMKNCTIFPIYLCTVFSVYFFNLDSADAVLYEFPKILTILE